MVTVPLVVALCALQAHGAAALQPEQVGAALQVATPAEGGIIAGAAMAAHASEEGALSALTHVGAELALRRGKGPSAGVQGNYTGEKLVFLHVQTSGGTSLYEWMLRVHGL